MKKITLFILILLTLSTYSQPNFPNVIIETTEGIIEIKLYNDTPLHSQNFVKLVNEGYYNGQLFHRVIKNFMVQAGDPNSINATTGQPLGSGGPDYMTPPEFKSNHIHKKGALAAARQGDNVNPYKYSSGSQFYIVQGNTVTEAMLTQLSQSKNHKPYTPEQIKEYTTLGGAPHLDNEYTVFGEVVRGLDIIDKIASAPVDQRARPITDIRIIKAYTKK